MDIDIFASMISIYKDYIAVIIIFALFVLYGVFRGNKDLSELALAIPIASFLYTFVPFKLNVSTIVVFIGLVIFSSWIVSRYTSGIDDESNVFKLLLAAFGATGVLIVIVFSVGDFSGWLVFNNYMTSFLRNLHNQSYILFMSLVAIGISRKL